MKGQLFKRSSKMVSECFMRHASCDKRVLEKKLQKLENIERSFKLYIVLCAQYGKNIANITAPLNVITIVTASVLAITAGAAAEGLLQTVFIPLGVAIITIVFVRKKCAHWPASQEEAIDQFLISYEPVDRSALKQLQAKIIAYNEQLGRQDFLNWIATEKSAIIEKLNSVEDDADPMEKAAVSFIKRKL